MAGSQSGVVVSTGVEQLSQGMDKLLQKGAEKVRPLREVREETQVLRTRLEELEASLSRLEARSNETYPMEVSHGPGEESDDDR